MHLAGNANQQEEDEGSRVADLPEPHALFHRTDTRYVPVGTILGRSEPVFPSVH